MNIEHSTLNIQHRTSGIGDVVRANWRAMAVVLVLALALNFGLGLTWGLSRSMESDAHYFLQAAQSLVAGQGFRIHDTFWPDEPAMSRSPGWPFVVSLALRCAPSTSPDLIMRCLALALNSLVAILVFLLTKRLIGRQSVALLAGLGYAIHPVALSLAYEGASEPLFVFAVLGGVLLLLRDRVSSVRCQGGEGGGQVSGFILLGLACLVRPNFLPWIVFFACLLVWRQPIFPFRFPLFSLRSALCALLFLAPSFLWAVRNYQVCGHFPVLSTLRGQTFYGGNNPTVAEWGKYWGYWVFPNAIPGEKTMAELATTLTEYEVDEYYTSKGKRYLGENLQAMPRLLAGKLVRAYAPVPWTLTWGSGAVSAFRWCLYLVAAVGIWRLWRETDNLYKAIFGAMVLANVTTVLVFWGCARFAFPLDPFLLPFAAATLVRPWDELRN